MMLSRRRRRARPEAVADCGSARNRFGGGAEVVRAVTARRTLKKGRCPGGRTHLQRQPHWL